MANEIYNTSWWGTALDTARTAGTNPDFFGSQFKLLTSEQDNLVTNGDFATDSDWNLGSGWSIEDGVAKATSAPFSASIYQSISTGTNKVYEVQIEIKNYISGVLRAINRGGYVDLPQSNGTHIVYLQTQSSGDNNLYLESRGNFTGSIDNVSVQLVRAELDQIEAKKCLADWIHTTALKDLNN